MVEGFQGELPLPGAVEQRGVALEAEEERMLADDRRRESVVGLDGQLVGIDVLAVGEHVEDAASHLLRRLDREGEADDLLGTSARFDPAHDHLLERSGLAGAGAGGDPDRPALVVEDPALLVGRDHSGTSAP
jgi:hypothetical protein